MIQYLELPPSNQLSPFIECFWILKSHGSSFKKRELIIPGGRVEIIFNLGNPVQWIDSKEPCAARSFDGAYLLGPRNRPFFVEQNCIVHAIGARFRHGGLASFCSIPTNDVINDVIQADQIFGTEINDLTQRLFEIDSAALSVNIIQNFLTQRIYNVADTQRALQLISWVKESEYLTLNAVTEKTGIHYKKLERLFLRYTGYNPKNFTRVVRFYRTLKEMNAKRLSLTGVGMNGGYYDQPHFIRDFKAFTGKTPSKFTSENPTIANFLLQSKHV